MLVGDVMQTRVVTVAPYTRVPEALGLAQHRGIRHLPVVDERLVGIVSDRDLKRALGAGGAEERRVDQIMTRAVVTVTPAAPVEEAARVMLEERISALPVVEGGRLVGIVTETDVVELFARAMGAAQPSSRLDVVLGERPGALGDAVQAIEGAGATICSIVTLARGALREAIVRVATINPGPAVSALEARGFTVRDARRPRLAA